MIPANAPTPNHAPNALPSTGPFPILLGSMSMFEVRDLTTTDARAERSMIAFRWPYGVRCPEPACGSVNIRERRSYKRPNELPMQFVCRACDKKFTVRDGCFLRHSPKPLTFWFWAIYLVAATPESDPVTPASLTQVLDVTEDCAADIIERIQEHIRDTVGGIRSPMIPSQISAKTPRPLHVTSTSGPDEPSHTGRRAPQ